LVVAADKPKQRHRVPDTYTATISGVLSYTDGDTLLDTLEPNGNTTGSTITLNTLGTNIVPQ
jgi:hypothetical protein